MFGYNIWLGLRCLLHMRVFGRMYQELELSARRAVEEVISTTGTLCDDRSTKAGPWIVEAQMRRGKHIATLQICACYRT